MRYHDQGGSGGRNIIFFQAIDAPAPKAVSYTHLDVYKRQVLKRYHSDAVHLRYIIRVSGLRLKTSEELAVTVILTLMQALKGREADDDLFWRSYELIVRGACSRLF